MKHNYFFLALVLFFSCDAKHYKLTERIEGPGFFSEFHAVLGALNHYEESEEIEGLEIDFQNGGNFFDPHYGRNFWSYFFEPIKIEKVEQLESTDTKRFRRHKKTMFSLQGQYELSRERSFELIQRYIKPKPHIQEKINAFYEKHFKDKYVIGIHYRGTDKHWEAENKSYEQVCNAILGDLTQHSDAIIFVATDDQKFLDYAHDQFPGKVVNINMKRSTNDKPLHYPQTNHMYEVGESAVLDCYLLSECTKLFKMASNLSDASSKINQHIPVVN